MDLFRGECNGVTVRTVLWLVEHLPEDSAFHASLRGGAHHRPWTTQVHLQAAAVNLLYAANRQRGGKPTKTPLVKPPTKGGRRKARVLDLRAVKARLDAAG